MADADVVVGTAAAPLTVHASRLDYLHDNAAIVDAILDALPAAGAACCSSSPTRSTLCTRAWRRGLDRGRVVGYTLNDSLRLRTAIGRVLGISSAEVDAWVIGEHGGASVPLYGRARANGAPGALTDDQRREVEEFTKTWYVRHVALDSGRSSTWTSGVGVSRMVAAVLHPSDELWPASVVLDGEYGIEGVALGVPVSLGRGGVERIHEWELAPDEQAALARAAGLVSQAASAPG